MSLIAKLKALEMELSAVRHALKLPAISAAALCAEKDNQRTARQTREYTPKAAPAALPLVNKTPGPLAAGETDEAFMVRYNAEPDATKRSILWAQRKGGVK